ncbi:MAG: pantetheine-phosphate adenylyltransferase [Clostridia bacterium]|nr:pantetheine-phosphate adenylyltransferase [Clostridia bacterium]
MKAIVTGSFDPITLGHMELIKYACERYDTVYVVALVNEAKEYMFTLEQKKRLIEMAISGYKNAIADAYSGLTADYMHKMGITHIIRGVRDEQDMVYEKNLAQRMSSFDTNFETEIIKCGDAFSKISSTAVRDRLKQGEDVSDLLPVEIADEAKEFFLKNQG